MTALTKLFRTTTFRLSLTYLALFSAAAIVAIAYIYWNTTVLLSRQLNQTIDAELKGLAEQYRAGGLEQLVRTVALRAISALFRPIYGIASVQSSSCIGGRRPAAWRTGWPLPMYSGCPAATG